MLSYEMKIRHGATFFHFQSSSAPSGFHTAKHPNGEFSSCNDPSLVMVSTSWDYKHPKWDAYLSYTVT